MFDFLRRNRFPITIAVLLVVAAGLVASRSGDRVRNDTLGRLFLDGMAPVMLWLTYPSLSSGMIALGLAAILALVGTLIYVHKKARLWVSGR